MDESFDPGDVEALNEAFDTLADLFDWNSPRLEGKGPLVRERCRKLYFSFIRSTGMDIDVVINAMDMAYELIMLTRDGNFTDEQVLDLFKRFDVTDPHATLDSFKAIRARYGADGVLLQ